MYRHADDMTHEAVAEATERLRVGTGKALLGPGTADLVTRRAPQRSWPRLTASPVSIREANVFLAPHWVRYAILVGLDLSESGDELTDLTDRAVLIGRGRADDAAALLAGLVTLASSGDRQGLLNDLIDTKCLDAIRQSWPHDPEV